MVEGNLTLIDSADNKSTHYIKLSTTDDSDGIKVRGSKLPETKPNGDEGSDYLTVTGGFITGGNYLSGIQVFGENASLTMNGGTICGNFGEEEEYGGGVSVYEKSSFTMSGGNIYGNYSINNGGGVLVYDTGSSFNMEGGTILHNTVEAGCGGGLYSEGGCFFMSGGAICHNKAADVDYGMGGGIYLKYYDGSESFEMSGGQVYENTAGAYGGGVYVEGNTSFIVNDGSISKNQAINGGGVFVGCDANFTFNKGDIKDNSAKGSSDDEDGNGAGVYIEDGAVFTMNNGEIKENSATGKKGDEDGNGAGVYIEDGAVFTMNNGKIEGNSAKGGNGSYDGNGAGVYIVDGAVFTLNKGEIKDNSVDGYGGGIYIEDGTFSISDNCIISDNFRENDNSKNNVFLQKYDEDADEPVITVTGELTGSDGCIGVTLVTEEDDEFIPITGVFAVADDEYQSGKLKDTDIQKFTSDISGYMVVLNDDGEAELKKIPSNDLIVPGNYEEGKTDPVITKAPKAIKGLVANGKPQALITAGEVTGGTFWYAVTEGGILSPDESEYSTAIPRKTEVGIYDVWYKVIGDETHNDINNKVIEVRIADGPPSKVPTTEEGQRYAAPEDNLAPIASSNKINDLKLDFSKIAGSGVDPNGLKMTVIKGSKLRTTGRLKDKRSVITTGGVKVKVNKNTLEATVSCKKDGSATFIMEDDSKYTVNFKINKPKAQKAFKTIQKGSQAVTLTVKDLFGTDIDSGELTLTSQKLSQVSILDNKLIIKPEEKDTIKIQYVYLNKKYRMTIKIV